MAQEGASAQPVEAYPTRPIRVVVPFGIGSTTDTLARMVAQKMTERWGRPVVVDNRAGAGGNIGTEIVAKAPADGYTLLVTAGSHAINPSLYKRLPFDAVKDFAPITELGASPQLLAENAAVPASSVRELIALARAQPGQLRYASAGSGSPSHLALELFRSMAHVDLTHVPYKGGDALIAALLSGEVQLYAGNIRSVMPHVKTGRLKALAVTGAARVPAVPDIPTVAESGVAGYNVTAWWGMLAPANTPRPVVTRLHDAVVRNLQAPETRERLAAVGIDVVASSPDEFARFIRREMETWSKVVRESGARPD